MMSRIKQPIGPEIQSSVTPLTTPAKNAADGAHPPETEPSNDTSSAPDREASGISISEGSNPFETEEREEATAEQPAADDVFTGLEALRAGGEGDDETGEVDETLAFVKVGRPDKRIFIRFHPEWSFPAYAWEAPPDKGQLKGETYFVPKTARGLFIRDDENALKRVDVVPYIDVDGNIGLWPIAHPGAGSKSGGEGWALSAQKVVRVGKTKWLKVITRRGAYTAVLSPTHEDKGEPVWRFSFEEILEVGIRHPIIADADSEVYRQKWLGIKPGN
jgi:hypothetical protein